MLPIFVFFVSPQWGTELTAKFAIISLGLNVLCLYVMIDVSSEIAGVAAIMTTPTIRSSRHLRTDQIIWKSNPNSEHLKRIQNLSTNISFWFARRDTLLGPTFKNKKGTKKLFKGKKIRTNRTTTQRSLSYTWLCGFWETLD